MGWLCNQIHIFHRYRTKENLVPHDNGTDIRHAILKFHFDRSDIWYHFLRSIRQGDFLLAGFVKGKLNSDMIWNDKMRGSSIGKCLYINRFLIWQTWI